MRAHTPSSLLPDCQQIADDILADCLAKRFWDRKKLASLLSAPCGGLFFSVVVEGLADRFDPALNEIYADLFSDVLEFVYPGSRTRNLRSRVSRIERPTIHHGDVVGVFILSRVTVGADVAIVSTIMDGMKRRFPHARIVLVANDKSGSLYKGDPRIEHLLVDYPRWGSVSERIAVSVGLRKFLDRPGWIVVDPDSRLTQLGLIAVCDESAYYFFPSRSYGSQSSTSLCHLTRDWLRETFEIESCKPYVAPKEQEQTLERPAITVSFGHGGNPSKRLDNDFEQSLLRALVDRQLSIYLDGGAGGLETSLADNLSANLSSVHIHRFDGSVSAFAALVRQSNYYLGYDSSGQHIAAACGVPFVSIFRGFGSERFANRWRPSGAGPGRVILANPPTTSSTVLYKVLSAFDSIDRTGFTRFGPTAVDESLRPIIE